MEQLICKIHPYTNLIVYSVSSVNSFRGMILDMLFGEEDIVRLLIIY